MSWEISPFVGIGVIRLGTPRAEIRFTLGGDFTPFQKGDCKITTDAYDRLGMHFYYDDADRLEFIEVFEPASLSFAGIELVDRDAATVIDELADLGYFGRDVNAGYQFDEQGFSFYTPRSTIEGVAVFRRGYYDRLATTD